MYKVTSRIQINARTQKNPGNLCILETQRLGFLLVELHQGVEGLSERLFERGDFQLCQPASQPCRRDVRL